MRFFSSRDREEKNMEKKLYRVKVVLFVMAENESDARMAATRAKFDIFECTARKAKDIDPEWSDAVPYNADDERVCSEILINRQQAIYAKPNPVKLPQNTNVHPPRSSISSRRGDSHLGKAQNARPIV
jgi:hypothetical protein